jgi:hypothetical protein
MGNQFGLPDFEDGHICDENDVESEVTVENKIVRYLLSTLKHAYSNGHATHT